MSTEHQQYSPESQLKVLRQYAGANNMEIVQEHSDLCAEQFENDASMSSSVVKTLKRSMAAEYSRELSVKVFSGQCRLIELGFRQGGPAGYGLRRQLMDRNQAPKRLLGERKSLQTDRVILVPGPEEEIDVFQQIYTRFVTDKKTEREIAASWANSAEYTAV